MQELNFLPISPNFMFHTGLYDLCYSQCPLSLILSLVQVQVIIYHVHYCKAFTQKDSVFQC